MGTTKNGALLLLSVLVTALLAMSAVSAAAQQYPPAPPDLVVGDTTIVVGDTVTLSFTGFEPGSEVTLTINLTPLAEGPSLFVATIGPMFLAQDEAQTITLTTIADANGVATFTFELPEGLEEGTVPAVVSGIDENGQPVAYSVEITVVDEAAGAPGDGSSGGDGVAATGAGITNLMVLVVAFLVLGGGALAYAKGRAVKDEEATTRV